MTITVSELSLAVKKNGKLFTLNIFIFIKSQWNETLDNV